MIKIEKVIIVEVDQHYSLLFAAGADVVFNVFRLHCPNLHWLEGHLRSSQGLLDRVRVAALQAKRRIRLSNLGGEIRIIAVSGKVEPFMRPPDQQGNSHNE